jgi:hypothetical protein
LIYDKNLYEAQETKQYRLLKNVFNTTLPVAIPYWSLFENTDYIDCIIHDTIQVNVSYDERLQSFVFNNLQMAFIGIEVILKKLKNENPCDYEIEECSNISTKVLKFIKESSCIDELSSVLNGLNI